MFLCSLDPIEKLGLMGQLRDIVDHRRDSIMLIDLGEPGRASSPKIETMGTSLALPTDGPTII